MTVDWNDYDKIDNAFALQSGALAATGGPAGAPSSHGTPTPAALPPEAALLANQLLAGKETPAFAALPDPLQVPALQVQLTA